jgi:hypothetical protein
MDKCCLGWHSVSAQAALRLGELRSPGKEEETTLLKSSSSSSSALSLSLLTVLEVGLLG